MSDVLFEARVRLADSDIAEAREGVGEGLAEDRMAVLEQAVQNVIGHTGARVTCVFEED